MRSSGQCLVSWGSELPLPTLSFFVSPSIEDQAARERDLFLDFSDQVVSRKDLKGTASWDVLTMMQHEGTPTRLLDWTEVLGVAVHFAIRCIPGQPPPPSPAIWVINPFRIARLARQSEDRSIGDFSRDPEMCYYKRFIASKSWPFEKPMPFRPPKSNERIRAQHGFFTVHGNNPLPLETQFLHQVRQIRLSRETIQDAHHNLKVFGINELAMFPDALGYNAHIQQTYAN
jgi:FRG domain